MLKQALWVLPVLALGMASGSVALSNSFASSITQTNTPSAQGQQTMQQALTTPQGQAMIQACSNFMSQFQK
ncbi:hypothetical protein [Alicyclobacillus macrosporangiidus]|jgi:hypothetical protein|uniref:hypothetical protein n=1 Tax=Alicyclobacillus macrosporangiidus TaxID=392015 RepID=UPI000497C0B8|nr:hypothetical protein [Alicyclobacillus macrosporangiidus]